MSRVDKSFNCCGKKQGDLYVTTLNFLASAFHFTLAFGQPLALSYWRIDADYDDDKLQFQVMLYIGLAVYWFGTIWAMVLVNTKPKEKLDIIDIEQEKRNIKIIPVYFSLIVAFSTCVNGMVGISGMLDGTFPLVYTIAPNTANPSPPFDSATCNGVDYSDGKTVFEWTQCIRDNPLKRDLSIYNVTGGNKLPWSDAAGEGCAAREDSTLLCSDDDTFNGYNSNTACVFCGGGKSCARRACQIEDNPGSFVQVSNDGDPSSFIQIGITQVVWPVISNTSAEPGSYMRRSNTGMWVQIAEENLEAGNDTVRFRQVGYEKGKYEVGTYMGDDQVEYSRKYYVWWLLFGFSIITSGFHIIAALSGWNEIDPKVQERYLNMAKLPMDGGWSFESGYLFELENGKTPYRWWEYSITASIMFLIVLANSESISFETTSKISFTQPVANSSKKNG